MSATVLDRPIVTLADAEYFAAEGLSQSGMKDLSVSPFRYWYLNINPNRPVREPSIEMKLGSALHCAVLEPSAFEDRYCCEFSADTYCGDLLSTVDDMRQWIKDKGHTPKGTTKAGLISQVQSIDASAPILEVLKADHFAANEGKVFLPAEIWDRVTGAAASLMSEPKVEAFLESGRPEVPIFRPDPNTGVPLKGKLDWVAPNLVLDIKTFRQMRGKSIDKSINDAIWYENYLRQAYFYSLLMGWPKWNGDFVFLFVESEPPYEVRIKSVRAKRYGQPNTFWEHARLETAALIRLYATCVERFGADPWRTEQDIEPLQDEDIKQLIY